MQIRIWLWNTANANTNILVDSLVFAYKNGQRINVDMFEAAPKLILSQANIDFGNAMVGCSITHTITTNRDDSSPLGLHATVNSTNPSFLVDQAHIDLATYNDSQVVNVTFTPVDSGSQEGYIIFTNDGVNSPDSVAVSGWGGALPDSAIAVRPNFSLGWQMVALPGTIAPGTCSATLHPLFKFNNGYKAADSMAVGVGYWYKVSTPVLFIVNEVRQETIAVASKWNMVGSIARVSVNEVVSEPPGMTISPFYGYNGAYFTADTLIPGHAYWVKANNTGLLVLHPLQLATSTNFGKIIIVDNGELPPPPPEGGITPPNESGAAKTPTEFSLLNNYPNPFNPVTNISYSLPEASFTTLKIYNMLGQEIATLVNGVTNAGKHQAVFNASQLPSGIYIYRLQSGTNIAIQKMVVMR
ncbi:MAG: T9SS type A sorting domain-containing protein [Bacteroidota bacterium]